MLGFDFFSPGICNPPGSITHNFNMLNGIKTIYNENVIPVILYRFLV